MVYGQQIKENGKSYLLLFLLLLLSSLPSSNTMDTLTSVLKVRTDNFGIFAAFRDLAIVQACSSRLLG